MSETSYWIEHLVSINTQERKVWRLLNGRRYKTPLRAVLAYERLYLANKKECEKRDLHYYHTASFSDRHRIAVHVGSEGLLVVLPNKEGQSWTRHLLHITHETDPPALLLNPQQL